MLRNWEELGIEWEETNVSTEDAEGKKVTYAGAQIMRVAAGQVEAFVKAAQDAGVTLADVLNGSQTLASMSRDVKRRNPQLSGNALKEAIWQRFVGQRASRVTIATPLPNGTLYSGSSRVEYVAQYLAACVDLGIPAEVGRTLAESTARNLEHLS